MRLRLRLRDCGVQEKKIPNHVSRRFEAQAVNGGINIPSLLVLSPRRQTTHSMFPKSVQKK